MPEALSETSADPRAGETEGVPDVSVVTVFHNRGDMLRDSLASLQVQTLRSLEIIVVNDGSTDDTAAKLAAFSDHADRRMVIRSHANVGFTSSLRLAVEGARGRYVAVHGSGDVSAPERLAKQAAILDAHPQIGVVGCLFDNSESHNEPFRKAGLALNSDFHQQVLREDPFTHGAVMFRRSVYDRVGGYRDVFRFAQDRDLWLRMSVECGYAIVPEVLYRRRQPANAVNRNPVESLLQSYFVDFAIQCAHARNRGDPDPVEAFGPAAFLLRTPSPRLSRRLLNAGLRAKAYDRGRMGDLYLQAAAREASGGPVSWGCAALRLLERVGIWRHVRPLVFQGFERVARRRTRERQQAEADGRQPSAAPHERSQ